MDNILESVRLISHRGQLYEGERQRMTEEDSFIFGDAEYYTTSYAEASTYAKASIALNPDLVGNIERLSKEYDEEYADVRKRMLEAGDGKVITSYIASDRMMVYGMEGKQFFDISDEPLFRRRFDLALVEIDTPREERERLSNFVVKFNDDPTRVMAALKQKNYSQVLRNFASICNCDSFMTHTSITPHASVLRRAGMDNSHVMVLNKSKIHVLRTDGEPITMDEELFNSPNTPIDVLNDSARKVIKASEKKEWDIACGVRFKVEVIAESLRSEHSEAPQSTPQSSPPAKPTQSMPTARNGIRV
ncbi:hypothetical protein OTK49_21155 [Vibrio coralliirubri]|uniref:hypothetical protein n=1 Tax=Vibrio coralliirubri TaxID=1516159 RepID=UPI002284B909|nr:hypothetical protein [Vibrio coralliirubri]MCY9865029.1 hypothetical protein [Vibrio coralliirubri]